MAKIDNRALFLTGLIIFTALFLTFGIPGLKKVQGKKVNFDKAFEKKKDISEDRLVDIDISIENVCMNQITGEPNGKCTGEENCKNACRSTGCRIFGLDYYNSTYTPTGCICMCYEENPEESAQI